MMWRAVLLAMLGQIDEAWAVAVPATEQALTGAGGICYGGGIWLAEIALIAGDRQAAPGEHLTGGCEDIEAAEEDRPRSSPRTYPWARPCPLPPLGQPDEAEQLARKGRELGDPDDVWTQGSLATGAGPRPLCARGARRSCAARSRKQSTGSRGPTRSPRAAR